MKFIIRRASDFYGTYKPCNGAVLEEMNYTYDGQETSEKVWTLDIPENLKDFLSWVELVGERVVIEKDCFFCFYTITIYDFWIE